MAWIWVSSWSRGTGWPLMEYPPPSASSSTIWLGGALVVWGVSGGGTWTSSAMRLKGWVIMKMISTTRSTSIIGVTLMSDCTPPEEAPAVIAILLLLLLVFIAEHDRLVRFRDRSHDPDAGAPRRLRRFLHLGVLQLVVGLEVQDLVLGPGSEDRAKLVFQRIGAARQGAPIQEIVPALI